MSIGYKGVPLPGMDSSMFDEKKGIVQNQHGRVVVNNDGNESRSVGGLYVSGWLKRGPSGIIGTNIADAKDTVLSIMEDLIATSSATDVCDFSSGDGGSDGGKMKGRNGLDKLLMERQITKVDWESYEKIDAKEKDPSRLRSSNQPREKITSLHEMLQLIK